MHFQLPRRHRRQLLFPPGLLALAGLLWLGCVAVRGWQQQLKRWYCIQLTMPIYPPPARVWEPTIRFYLPNPDTICKSCAWKDLYLTGRNDSEGIREQIRVEDAIHAMMNDVGHGKGVRIHLVRAARYKHLVFVLNTLNRADVRKYWLDIYHNPNTLYAFNEAPVATSQQVEFDCLLCNDVVPYVPAVPQIPFWVRFDDAVTEFWRFPWLQPLWQQEWRASIWLLAVIILISFWRIIRTRLTP